MCFLSFHYYLLLIRLTSLSESLCKVGDNYLKKNFILYWIFSFFIVNKGLGKAKSFNKVYLIIK